MKKLVLCTCQYCHEAFVADSRHPHAQCCGCLACRRKANAIYARKYYYRLKVFNPKAYSEMLARKKCERELRRTRESEGHLDVQERPLSDIHPASPQVLSVLVSAILTVSCRRDAAFPILFQEHLRQAAETARSPRLLEKMSVFLNDVLYLKS